MSSRILPEERIILNVGGTKVLCLENYYLFFFFTGFLYSLNRINKKNVYKYMYYTYFLRNIV
jgi:hypothetical protein